MEARFSTVTKYDEVLYRELMEKKKRKLGWFRRYYITISELALLTVFVIRSAVLEARGQTPGEGLMITLGVMAAVIAAATFWIERKNGPQSEDRAVRAKVRAMAIRSGKAGEKEEVYWFEDHCIIQTADYAGKFCYTGLRRIVEEEHYYFLYFGGDRYIPADKNGFRTGRPEKFLKFVQSKISEKG